MVATVIGLIMFVVPFVSGVFTALAMAKDGK